MTGRKDSPSDSAGKIIRPADFDGAPEQPPASEVEDPSAVRVQVKAACTPEKLGRKIIAHLTTELRSIEGRIVISNRFPHYRVLINALGSGYPEEVILAVVFTSVLNMTAIYDIDLSDENLQTLGVSEDQIAALKRFKSGADLHHAAMEHGLQILEDRGRTIEPYESILSLEVIRTPTERIGRVIRDLAARFGDEVLDRENRD